MSEELEELRLSIDEEDRQIVAALCRRMELSEKIGELKRQKGLSVYVPERENAVLEKVRSLAGENCAEDMTEIYRRIMKLSRSRQENYHDN